MDDKDFNRDLPAADHATCESCRDSLQDYLDGTLDKKASLSVFLHLRDCEPCRVRHETMTSLFGMLDDLPRVSPPEDFDVAVLASVPYESYRAMAELRRERVPVFLEEHFLPAFMRRAAVRWSGVTVSALAAGGWLAVEPSPVLAVVAVVGLVPETAVLLQGLGRRMIGLGRVEG